jgi:hypothetical protein
MSDVGSRLCETRHPARLRRVSQSLDPTYKLSWKAFRKAV